MRVRLFLCIVLWMLSSFTDARTVLLKSLEVIIKDSDTIVVVQITSGKCSLKGCKDSQAHFTPKDYEFTCTGTIFGKCPSISKLTTSSDFCVGCSYVFLHQWKNAKDVFFPITLRSNNSRLVYEGWYWGIPAKLHQSEEGLNSVREYHYYDYKDFIAAVEKIKR